MALIEITRKYWILKRTGKPGQSKKQFTQKKINTTSTVYHSNYLPSGNQHYKRPKNRKTIAKIRPPKTYHHQDKSATQTNQLPMTTEHPTICTFWTSLLFVWNVFVRMSFTTHNTFRFFVQFGALCPKPWHLKHCWIEGVVLNSSTLKIMPAFWHANPPN